MIDANPPQLQSLTVGTPTLTTGGNYQVVVTARFTDDISGIFDGSYPDGSGGSSPQIWFKSPSGQTAFGVFNILQPVSGGRLDGLYQATVTLGQYAEAGTWKASWLLLNDEATNSVSLTPDNSALVAAADFSVSNTASTPTPYDDLLTGTIDADVIDGLGGDDTILGLGGNDVLTGGDGNDFLQGGAGNDTLTGGAGTDIIHGGDGNDLIYDLNTRFDEGTQIDAGAGDDTIYTSFSRDISGGTGNDQIYFTDFADGTIYGGDGDDTISGSLGGSGWYTVDGQDGNDQITLSGRAVRLTVNGGVGDDSVDASSVTSLTTIHLNGGLGNDVLIGGAKSDIFYGGMGADTLTGGSSSDVFRGTLVELHGDIITDASGDSLFIEQTISSPSQIKLSQADLTGTRVLSIDGDQDGVFETTISVRNFTDGFISVQNSDLYNNNIIRLIRANTLSSTPGNDLLVGTPLSDIIYGGDGDDEIFGLEGDDTLYGGAGNNRIEGDSGNDLIYGGEGDDTLFGGDGNDTIYDLNTGFWMFAYISGGSGNDTIYTRYSRDISGGSGDDYIQIDQLFDGFVDGGEGADTITGSLAGSGMYSLYGQEGRDAITLTGSALNLNVYGGSGDDSLDVSGISYSRDGIYLNGGDGDDRYVISSEPNSIFEEFGQGNDTVTSSVSYTLGSNVENLTYSGVSQWINGYLQGGQLLGNDLANVILGNEAVNVLAGMAGQDQMDGRDGSDIYLFQSVDIFGRNFGEINDTGTTGTDEVRFFTDVDLTLTLFAEDRGIERVVIGNSPGSGTSLEANTNIGGDLSIDASRVLNSLHISGNAGSNTLRATAFSDVILGNAGNDIIYGNAGDDTVDGGDGSDIANFSGLRSDYIVTRNNDGSLLIVDLRTEAGDGTDTYRNVEQFVFSDLTLDSTAVLNNPPVISSNGGGVSASISIAENGSAVTTITTADPDAGTILTYSIVGGADSAKFQIDTSTGALSFINAPNFEAPTDAGANNVYDVTVQVSDGSLTDTQAIAVTVTNQSPEDVVGTNGDDTFLATSDPERFNGLLGSDTVSHINATLGVVASLSSPAGNTGFAQGDTYTSIENLTGSNFNDTLTGDAGANILSGGTGTDALVGLAGDDTYVVNLTSTGLLEDTVTEAANAGTDSLVLEGTTGSAAAITLAANLENIDGSRTGTRALNLTGNTAANIIKGNAAANIITGGAAADNMDGGDGSDLYVIAAVADYATGEVINDTGTANSAADEIRYTGTAAATLTLNNSLQGVERFVIGTGTGQPAVTTGTGAINVNAAAVLYGLSITGNNGANIISGTGFADTIVANGGNDTLNGGAGADTMTGGAGNDTYVVDNAGDVIVEAAAGGTDLVQVAIALVGGSYTLGAQVENATLTNTVSFNLTGNAVANTLTGNTANNILDGGAGVDSLIGLAGNDTYNVDLTTAGALQDTVTEAANAGTDTIVLRGLSTNTAASTITIGANVEALDASATGNSFLNFTGNALVNTITGNTRANVITGGALGDTMNGLDGGDIYLVASTGDYTGDVINDTGPSGIDEFRFTATAASTLALTASTVGLERAVIGTGTAATAVTTGTTAISLNASAVGNGLTITGNDGNNTLTGTSFNDILEGNGGNDTLVGNGGADRLFGGLGNDTLTGGAGTDSFIFNTATNATTNRDTITDFNVVDDTIQLENAIFSALGAATGTLGAGAFVIGAAAVDAADRIVYNSGTGALFYDSNGNAAGGSVQIATLATGLALSNNDFLII